MDFDAAVTLLTSPLVEGGYSNNRLDPGGETMWGVTKRLAFKYGYTGPMRALPKAKAISIYQEEFWKYLRCDEMPEPLRYPLFDCGVNEGRERAAGFLNDIVGIGADQTAVTDESVVNANAFGGWPCVSALLGKRIRHYTSLPTWTAFGRGWMNRMATNCEVLGHLKEPS